MYKNAPHWAAYLGFGDLSQPEEAGWSTAGLTAVAHVQGTVT
jgi:hypothetical protein